MNKNWLFDRLTKARQDSPVWTDFVHALQSLMTNHAEQYITRMKKKVSLFDADKRDLTIMLRELGEFFVVGDVDDNNLPLVVMQRTDEIHLKKTINPLINTLVREFGGIKVTWEPLYAPVDQETYPYGTKFVIQSEIKDEAIPADQWFMTSRGVIRVPMQEVNRVFGVNGQGTDGALSEFEKLVKSVIYPLIPLRIVCDGQQYFLDFDLIEAMERMTQTDSAVSDIIPPTNERNERLFNDESGIKGEVIELSNNREPYPFPAKNRLDAFRCDGLPIDRYI